VTDKTKITVGLALTIGVVIVGAVVTYFSGIVAHEGRTVALEGRAKAVEENGVALQSQLVRVDRELVLLKEKLATHETTNALATKLVDALTSDRADAKQALNEIRTMKVSVENMTKEVEARLNSMSEITGALARLPKPDREALLAAIRNVERVKLGAFLEQLAQVEKRLGQSESRIAAIGRKCNLKITETSDFAFFSQRGFNGKLGDRQYLVQDTGEWESFQLPDGPFNDDAVAVFIVPVLRDCEVPNPALRDYRARLENGRIFVSGYAKIAETDTRRYSTSFRAYVIHQTPS
jgi:hypothetical protein